MRKKKLAVIGLKGLPAAGGGATVGENVLVRLKDEFEITVYSVSTHADIHGDYRGLKQIVLKGIGHPALNMIFYYVQATMHCIFKENYDLVHVHHLAGAFVLPMLYIKFPTIMTAHGNPEETDKWKSVSGVYYRIMRTLFYKFAIVKTTVSKVHKDEYENQCRCNVNYIPNGVDLSYSQLSISSVGQNDYLLFAAARIIEIKGLHILLEACQNLNIQKKIVIIGDLDQVRGYRLKIEELAKDLNTEFIGLIKNKDLLYSYIKYADYFIFPSLVEAMSSMLLETAALEVPVICSDIPENKAVFDGNEMLFFEAGNVTDLQDKLIWAEKHKKKMLEKARKAYKKVESQYNWEKIAKQYGAIYHNV